MVYQVQSLDTSYEAEQVQIKIFRRRGEAGRGDLMRSLTRTTRALSWNALLQRATARPRTRKELALFFIELNYGKDLAAQCLAYFEKASIKEEILLNSDDMLAALIPVIEVLDELGVNYLIAGSVASSIHGIPRSTADADLVIDFKLEHVTPFIARLQDEYYVSEQAIQEALNRRSAFNVIHLATGFKLDLILLKNDQFNQTSFSRAVLASISTTDSRRFRLDAAEDVLLQKLRWYQIGNQVSDKQWLDILGILKSQEQLDDVYLEKWAKQLGLCELLTKAREASGKN